MLTRLLFFFLCLSLVGCSGGGGTSTADVPAEPGPSTVTGRVFLGVPSSGASIRIIALHASSFILGALALWCVLQMMGSYPLTAGLVGVYATAWLIGFLVPGAPAGLGIREALLLTGLGILYGAGSAAMGAVLLRAVTVAGDGLAFAAGLLMRRYRSLPSSDSRAG